MIVEEVWRLGEVDVDEGREVDDTGTKGEVSGDGGVDVEVVSGPGEAPRLEDGEVSTCGIRVDKVRGSVGFVGVVGDVGEE